MKHVQGCGAAMLVLLAPMVAIAQPAGVSNLPKPAQSYARRHGNLISPNAMPFGEEAALERQQIKVSKIVHDAIMDITEHCGLKQNFVVIPANIPNALAYMYNGQRVLYFNASFIEMAHDDIEPNWAVISILAHEVGHHLLGHIFVLDNNFKQRELEADEFSGFIMYRMGASLDEATITMRTLGMGADAPTHPGKAARMAAIERGWNAAAAVTVHEAEMSRRRDSRQAASPRRSPAMDQGGSSQ